VLNVEIRRKKKRKEKRKETNILCEVNKIGV
jgi:hypothetical protein